MRECVYVCVYACVYVHVVVSLCVFEYVLVVLQRVQSFSWGVFVGRGSSHSGCLDSIIGFGAATTYGRQTTDADNEGERHRDPTLSHAVCIACWTFS